MGAKHAGIHLRCDDSAVVLARLREEFSEKKGCGQKDMRGLEMIRTFVGRNISEIEDSAERAEKEEAVLEKELDGYMEYEDKVRYRILPFIW